MSFADAHVGHSIPPVEHRISEDDSWKKKNLLSFDGGGIRGYWSLLALEQLVKAIAEEEEGRHSYHSFGQRQDGDQERDLWPHHGISQIPFTDDEQQEIDRLTDTEGNTNGEVLRAMKKNRRYLPCHYFDYICGSSTGGLIAIMLGRLRMPVSDCIDEYERLGSKVFGNPRILSTLRWGLIGSDKYKSDLQAVFKDVAARRCEKSSDKIQRVTFPSKRGLCKTFVTSLITESDSQAVETLYLIRSYHHEERELSAGDVLSGPSRIGTGLSGESIIRQQRRRKLESNRNFERAQKLEIWEVARAATAALAYFEPLKIETPGSSKYILLTDAGIKATNNPTQIGTQEIEDMYGKQSIGIVVSIGTARYDERVVKKRILPGIPQIKGVINQGADPNIVHNDVQRDADERHPYYRLNDPHGLKMELDECIPKSSRWNGGKAPGSITLKTIQTAFLSWFAKDDVTQQFRACAAELVQRRIDRMEDEDRWERFATGAKFTCRRRGCEEKFIYRTLFKQHLKHCHMMDEGTLDKEVGRCKTQWQYRKRSPVQS